MSEGKTDEAAKCGLRVIDGDGLAMRSHCPSVPSSIVTTEPLRMQAIDPNGLGT